MEPHKFNVLMDLQWGSCGKGKFMPYLAEMYGIYVFSGSNRPNAGHTVRRADYEYVFKMLPSACVLEDWLGVNCTAYLSSGAAFTLEQYEKETLDFNVELNVHRRAQFVTGEDIEAEKRMEIASTGQGAGASLVRKIERMRNANFAGALSPEEFSSLLNLDTKKYGCIHECSQGWALSIDHGHDYPCVTSRNCGVAAALDQTGVNPRLLGDVYGIFRPYPIRVGNLGHQSSGPTYGDSQEIDWKDVHEWSGAPAEVDFTEFTTVTRRVRRIFRFSDIGLRHAIRCNGVNKLILNFAQHIDYQDYQKRLWRDLSVKTRKFIDETEEKWDVPIVLVGTGPDHYDVCVRP